MCDTIQLQNLGESMHDTSLHFVLITAQFVFHEFLKANKIIMITRHVKNDSSQTLNYKKQNAIFTLQPSILIKF